MSDTLTLFTINMSHYSEKVRWLLDASCLPYQEQPLTPALHTIPMLIKGRRWQTTVPLLQRGGECIQDSPRIVAWLTQHYDLESCLPSEERQQILAIQAHFDRIGKPIARFLYLPGFAHGALLRAIWGQFASPLARLFVSASYPVVKPMFQVKLRINERAVARARHQIDVEIQWLNAQLVDRRYLLGDRFTFADIAAASILAPLACPTEHPIYGHPEFRAKMASAASQWADSPALQWVRDMYALHRGPVWARMTVPPLLV